MEFLCVLIAGGILAVIVFVLNLKRIDSAWAEAAQKLCLLYEKEGLRNRTIFGEHAGIKVRISTYRTTIDNAKVNFTSYHVSFRESLGLDLNIERQRNGSRSSGNSQDIIVGDPVFDPKVIITGRDKNAIREFLDPDRRKLLHQLFKAFDEYEVDAKGIHVAKRGMQSNCNFLVNNLNLLITTVNELGRHQPQPVEDAPEVTPPPLPNRKSEPVNPDAEIGLKPAAVAEAVIADVEIKDDAELSEAKADQATAEPAMNPETVEIVPEVEPQAVLIADAHVDNAETREETAPVKVDGGDEFLMLCSQLFDSGMSRYEVGQQFDAHIKGQSQTGVGILKRVDKFYSDLVFGRGPGLSAQIDVLALEDGKTVTATVEFPIEETDLTALREKIGEPIMFSGKLLKCDVFTHRIYVGKAK